MAAGLAAVLAIFFGPVVVFWIMATLAVLTIVSALVIPADSIDDDLAQGLDEQPGEAREQPSGLRVLLTNRGLLVFAVLAATFHLANAAMLPSVGQLLTQLVGKNHATSLISVCIVGGAMRDGADGDPGRRQGRPLGPQADLPLRLRRARRARRALHALGQPVLAAGRPAARWDRRGHLRRAVPDRGRRPHPRDRPLQREPGRHRHGAGHRRRAEREPRRVDHRPLRLQCGVFGAGGDRPAGRCWVSGSSCRRPAGRAARPKRPSPRSPRPRRARASPGTRRSPRPHRVPACSGP